MIKSGTPTVSLGSGNTGIQISVTGYGKVVKLIYGLCKVAPDLVWYNDWETGDHPSNALLAKIMGSSSGKKGKKSGATYYSAATDMLLGHAPILGILSVYYNNNKFLVIPSSASGFVSGGQFSFTPSGGLSQQTLPAQPIPSSPYQITVSDFVSNTAVWDHSLPQGPGGIYGRAYLDRSDPLYPPGPFQYTVSAAGVYTFNAAQAGDSVSIGYFFSTPGAAATLVSIFAATVHEDFSQTFDDFGAPGSQIISGTWERPLWNAAFAVPGRVDSGAYRARDPYTWWWDGSTATANFPAALEGKPVTVYYGVPGILLSNGRTFSGSSLLTPLEILNMEFERSFASGSEYARHSGQQVVMPWCSGVGSPQLDLGVMNAVPSFNFETIGTFTLWPNGDADVADIVADIVASGPVLV